MRSFRKRWGSSYGEGTSGIPLKEDDSVCNRSSWTFGVSLDDTKKNNNNNNNDNSNNSEQSSSYFGSLLPESNLSELMIPFRI